MLSKNGQKSNKGEFLIKHAVSKRTINPFFRYAVLKRAIHSFI